MQNTSNKKYWTLDLFLLTFFIGSLFFIFLGAHNLLTPDEGRYTEIAREMAVNGNYITPFLNGIVFLDKPILFYWLECFSIKLFGLSEWSLRFWPCIFGIWGCLTTYIAGRFLFNRRTGILAAFILATSFFYYFMAHYANMDLEVAVLISTSLFAFIIASRFENSVKRSVFLYSTYIFAAFAVLTKGLIGIVFPGMIIFCWIIFLNNWRLLKKIHLLSGTIIFLLISAPWFILEQRVNHEFFHYFFFTQHILRFLTANLNNINKVWFYLPVIIIGIFPWFIFLGQTIWQKIKLILTNRKQYQTELFLLLWILLIVLFFSIPASKLIGYILPVFPAIALLIGSYLDFSLTNASTKGIKIGINSWIILSLSSAIILFYLPYFKVIPNLNLMDLKWYCYLAGIILFCSSFVSLFFSRRQKWLPVILVLFLTSALLQINILKAFPKFGFQSTKPFALQINSLLKPNDEIVFFYRYYYDLPVYIQRSVFVVENWDNYKDSNDDSWQRIFLAMSKLNGSEKKWLLNDQQLQDLLRNKRVFIVANKTELDSLKSLLGANFFIVSTYQKKVLVANFKY